GRRGGRRGLLGRQGEDGPGRACGGPGRRGEPGRAGERGPAGPQGLTGGGGPQGPAGKDGDTGPQGAQGPKGDPGEGASRADLLGKLVAPVVIAHRGGGAMVYPEEGMRGMVAAADRKSVV